MKTVPEERRLVKNLDFFLKSSTILQSKKYVLFDWLFSGTVFISKVLVDQYSSLTTQIITSYNRYIIRGSAMCFMGKIYILIFHSHDN